MVPERGYSNARRILLSLLKIAAVKSDLPRLLPLAHFQVVEVC